MSCREFRDDWEEYREGNLPPEAMDALREHLSSCPECQELLLEEEALDRCLGAWTVPGSVAGFDEVVTRRALMERERAAQARRGVRVPLPLAVSLLLLLAASLVLNLQSFSAEEAEVPALTVELAPIVLPPHEAADELPIAEDGAATVLIAGAPLPVKSHVPSFY